MTKSARRIRHHGAIAERIAIERDAAHKVADVLRLEKGDRIVIVDDEGREHDGVIASLSPHHLEVALSGEPRRAFELVPVAIAIPFIKGDRMDWAIEKTSESGAARILPYCADRSVPRACGAEKLARWRRIAESAALQAGTGRGTEVLDPVESLDAVVAMFECRAHLDIAGEPVASFLQGVPPDVVILGPEGGWTRREHELLNAKSRAVSLGRSTWRAESAAMLAGFLASLAHQEGVPAKS